MFVVEVCTERDPSASRTSAGRPEPASVIASKEDQVSAA
jgi:hypothetical protein